MGNDSSSSVSEGSGFIGKLNKGYDFMTEVSDPRFGDICVYRHRTEKKYIAKRGQMCNSEEEQLALIRSCRNRQHLKHKYVLQLLNFCEAGEDNICGEFNKITIYFEYYFHDLQKELQRRRDNGQEYFSESELWYLLDSMVQACSFFEKQQLYHGDIRPSNILLTNDGQVKVGEHGILLLDQSGYYKMLSRREKSYLTPSLLRSLSVGELKPFHSNQKTDVYSLGMSLLETASLCEPMSAYDMENYSVNKQALDHLFAQCRGRYSDFFLNVLREMLIEEENDRPSFQTLTALLQPFQNSIHTSTSNNGQVNNQSFQQNIGNNNNTRIVQNNNNSNLVFTPQPVQQSQSPLLQQSYVYVPPFVSPQAQFQLQNNAQPFQQPLPQQGTNATSVTAFQPTLETAGNAQTISFSPQQIQGFASQQQSQIIVNSQQGQQVPQQLVSQAYLAPNGQALTSQQQQQQQQLQQQIQQLQLQQLYLQQQQLLKDQQFQQDQPKNIQQSLVGQPSFQVQQVSASPLQPSQLQQQQYLSPIQQVPPRQAYQQVPKQNSQLSFQNLPQQTTVLPQSQLIQSFNALQQSNSGSETNQPVSFQPSQQQNQSTLQPTSFQQQQHRNNEEAESEFLKQVSDGLVKSNLTPLMNQDSQSTASQQKQPNISQQFDTNPQPWQSISSQLGNQQQQSQQQQLNRQLASLQQIQQQSSLQGLPQQTQFGSAPQIQGYTAPLIQNNGFYQSFTHLQQPQTANYLQQ